jgi:major membrane immunogen (membrane-anchored lipoprotein)
MKRPNEIKSELELLSPLLAKMDKTNPFSVPEGYFQQLSDNILEKTIYLPSFGNAPVSKPDVPEGYFENLATSILQKIKAKAEETPAEELKNLSPLLYSLKSEQVFTVPNGYFEGFADTVVSRINTRQQAKVVSFASRTRLIFKYAAAAVITGLVAVGSFLALQKSDDPGLNPSPAIAASETAAISQEIKLAQQFKSESEIRNEIEKLPTEEIVIYLEKTTSEQDIDLLISSVNEENLPAEEDYLLDENTLERYLNDVNPAIKTN